MKLTGITWITTYNCNLACKHCFFDTQTSKKYMDPELIDRALSDFKYDKHMFWQHLSGGEIFLNYDSLYQIIQNIRKYFAKNIGLSTNAFWAADEVKAKQILDELESVGITGIALSADYYHRQFMSLEGPKNLAKLVHNKKLTTHSYIMGAVLRDDVFNAAVINNKTERIFEEVNQGLNIPYARAKERSIGKGSTINIPKKKGIPQGLCTELNTCLGERSPFNPTMVWIDPYGNVMICYGIIIGNLYQQSLNSIIEEYSAEKYPILEKLAIKGPKALFELAGEKGISLEDEFYDECDICYLSRVALREFYPDIFGPDECYPI